MIVKTFRLFLVIIILLSAVPSGGWAAPASQTTTPTPQDNAKSLLARLTPEERVGQLFLVTFTGPEASPTSQATDPSTQIYDLIAHRHIGGVILLTANDNFVGADQTLSVAQSLTRQLQYDKNDASLQDQIEPVTGETFRPAFIPLFIGIIQQGESYPYDQILNGLTSLPSQMAIGATWQPELAKQVGTVLGSELSALGINLVIGPSLDVLQAPYSEKGGDLGISTFGGDPFWVGEMGRAFINGVHTGSQGEIAVVAKHFPGFGGSDRLPEDEVATVRKSLEQLKQIELAPFFAVTGNAPSPEATADALLTSHIRYQGFQGNIRATTKPVSFDQQAFAQLISLPSFASWRQNGGVMVSDDLGSRAVRRFYDPTGQTFDSRFVARDAFLAGNDLLYLGNFKASEDPDSYTSIVHTIDYFTQKYRQDTAFAQRVDESVLRILTLKYRLYNNNFSLNQIIPLQSALSQLGKSSQVSFDVARQAATLISPSQAELSDAIGEPPGRNDRIIFITDTRIYQQCSRCPQQNVLAVDTLEQAVIRLYSPQAGGPILKNNLVSYSFQDLQNMLDAGTGVAQIENDLRQAKWLIFAMLNANSDLPSSLALRHFLSQRPDLFQQKRLIVFGLNAPYYLDATDISKLTAFYGLYSSGPQFVDVAARLLFQEVSLPGALPVTVPGVGYDLITAMAPDPKQIIPLTLDLPGEEIPQTTLTPISTPALQELRTGSLIPLITGVIQDHNNRPVPDGTIVRFILVHSGETGATQQVETQTIKGIARATLRVDTPGKIQIRVESDPAKASTILEFVIPSENVTATPIPPSPTPTSTDTPTATPEPTATATATAVIPTPTLTATPIIPLPQTDLSDWLVTVLVAAVIGALFYGLALGIGDLRWGLRGAFLALIGGLLTYSYLALGFPGSSQLLGEAGLWGTVLVVLIGSTLGGGAAWVWRGIQSARE